MKRVLVYDVAAESGGALSILDQYYKKYSENKSIESIFLLSVIHYDDNERVRIINAPWVKKSWFHRLACDLFYVNSIIKKNNIDEVVSLQNVAIPFSKVPQTVYVQNAIPFSEHKFSIFESPFFWFYQKIIGGITINSLRKVDKIIVQTSWMKEAVISKCGCKPQSITVEKPVTKYEICNERLSAPVPIFFYPATAFRYKNHSLIISACEKLKLKGIKNYRVYFTIEENDNTCTKKWAKIIKNKLLPIEFIGTINKDEMENYYKQSALLFPSYLETVGLPLIEAQSFSSYVFAAKCLYAYDALADYNKAEFFSLDDDGDELSQLMETYIFRNCSV